MDQDPDALGWYQRAVAYEMCWDRAFADQVYDRVDPVAFTGPVGELPGLVTLIHDHDQHTAASGGQGLPRVLALSQAIHAHALTIAARDRASGRPPDRTFPGDQVLAHPAGGWDDPLTIAVAAPMVVRYATLARIATATWPSGVLNPAKALNHLVEVEAGHARTADRIRGAQRLAGAVDRGAEARTDLQRLAQWPAITTAVRRIRDEPDL